MTTTEIQQLKEKRDQEIKTALSFERQYIKEMALNHYLNQCFKTKDHLIIEMR